MDDPSIMAGLAGCALAALFVFLSIRAGRKQRLIDNIPTTKTTGVFMGLAELKGTAEAGMPLHSYLSEASCVFYRYSVAEHWSRTVTEHYTDSEGRSQTRTRHESGWTTLASGARQIPFFLKDDYGVVRVVPDGAKIEPIVVFDETCGRDDPLYYGKGPAHAVSDSDHRRCFREEAVLLHTPVYVMGQARERADVVAPEIAYDADSPIFLISTRSEEQVSGGLNTQFWIFGVLAVLFAVAGWVARAAILANNAAPMQGSFVQHGTPLSSMTIAIAGFGCFGVWGLAWGWMVLNSMIGLRQRVRQAWSNVDVQLKRRAELIPNLVRVVEGMRDHERTVHTELAKLRTQQSVTAPGEVGADPEGCSKILLGVVEAYPELKADAGFLDLQRQLADTEQRIALARAYFNDIATFYNTRLEIVPDRFIAAIARLEPRPLITAEDFERAPVKVALAE